MRPRNAEATRVGLPFGGNALPQHAAMTNAASRPPESHDVATRSGADSANHRAAQTILIIDDERDVVDMVSLHLKKAGGFAVSYALDGATGLRQAREALPALVLLDLMLPGIPGLEICKVLKAEPRTRNVPIIMLSAKAEEIDRIVGLELGADDYVTKPFSPRELILRIRAVLGRRDAQHEEEIVSVGKITIDISRNQVSIAGKPVTLTALEFKLLSKLMRGRGRVQSRERLLHEVWGYETAIDTRTVDTHVRRLRQKLGSAADIIVTVRGFGYRVRA